MKRISICIILAVICLSCQTQKKIGSTDRVVLIETKYGDMKVKLYDQTPKHRDNFITLASNKFFDATLFHRVIKDFMIQGGDPDSKGAAADKDLGEGGPGYTLDAEFNKDLFHKKGVIAAARESDDVNPLRKSAGSQFYIAQGKIYTEDELKLEIDRINQRRANKVIEKSIAENVKVLEELREKDMNKYISLVDSLDKASKAEILKTAFTLSKEQIEAYTTIGGIPHLDGQYTVFGEVIEGLDVLDKIAAVNVNDHDRPLVDVEMKITVIK